MKTIQDTGDNRLFWFQPDLRKIYFELRDGDDVVATMEIPDQPTMQTIGASAEGSWVIKYHGMVTMRAEVKRLETGEAVTDYNVNGGLFQLADGRRFGLLKTDRRGWQAAITAADGTRLFEFKIILERPAANQAFMTVESVPGARQLPGASLLVLLGSMNTHRHIQWAQRAAASNKVDSSLYADVTQDFYQN